MRKLSVFNATSLDGFFADANGDMSWAHARDPEWQTFAEANASGSGEFLFGRVTYELMARYWPTPMAKENNPVTAERMSRSLKTVFSKTLSQPSWANTKVINGDVAAAVRAMRQEAGADMVILGSGTIVSQLTEASLIDQYQIAVVPIILGKGRTLFEGLSKKLRLRLTDTRTFGNGNTVLTYEPAR